MPDRSLRAFPMLLVVAAGVSLPCAPAAARERPSVVDLRKFQTPIRSQGGRDACTYHPPIGALEAAYDRFGWRVELSVEHLIWIRNVTALKAVSDVAVNENNLASLTGGGVEHNFRLLQHYGVCPLRDMPYHPQRAYEDGVSTFFKGFQVAGYKWYEPFRQVSLNEWNMDPAQFPEAARTEARYGIRSYGKLSPQDCKDPAKLEEILASGREVAVNMYLYTDPRSREQQQADGDPVVRIRPGAKRAHANVSHAMLFVGYDRARRFFIVKNSGRNPRYNAAQLAPMWKDVTRYSGYNLYDYDHLASNREAVYIKEVINPRTDRFARQRALGQWQVEFRRGERNVASGVLVWRRLPNTAFWLKGQKDLRIGDYVDAATQRQYRVNARFGKGNQVTLYLDFARPQTGLEEARGTALSGTLSLPADGPGVMRLARVVPPAGQDRLFGVPAAELSVHATQSARNILKELRTGPE
jgi:hypothetical protein